MRILIRYFGPLFLFFTLVSTSFSQMIQYNIIDLRNKTIYKSHHKWSFKPGDSSLDKIEESGNMDFSRAREILENKEKSGWIDEFPVQLSFTRYKDKNGVRPFADFNEYFKKYSGYGWYRTAFNVSKNDLKEKFGSKNLVLLLGKIGQADAVYINGEYIGGTGLDEITPPDTILDDADLYYDKTRMYSVPLSLLHLDRPNVISVRVFAKYYISPGLSHGRIYIGSDNKLKRAAFWDNFKKIFLITLASLLGIFYLYWQYLFRGEEHATIFFALGAIAMAANTLMRSQVIFDIYDNGLWIKKFEFITYILLVHFILDFIVRFSRIKNRLTIQIGRIWHILALVAVIAVLLIGDLLTVRRFMFAWGVAPILLLANIIYLVIEGRKIPSMGVVAFGLFGSAGMLVNDVLVGFQFPWVTWEVTLIDYSYAFFSLSVAMSIVSNMIKSREVIARQQKEKERLSRYFSPDVMETIIAEDIEMGGQEKPIATLFADIVGFTSFSEKRKPAEVVEKLNFVFEKLSSIIFDHGATLDKYIGDCIMAFWGAPKSTEHDAYNAIACALKMQEELGKMKTNTGGNEMPFTLRIGVNYGPSIVGNIGSQKRMDYTVIGDAVNTASRIESNGKPGRVAVSGATFEAAGGETVVRYSEINEIMVKGKTEPVKVYIVESIAGR